MMQRYDMDYDDDGYISLDKSVLGEFYKVSDIIPLIEWRELSKDCKPNDEEYVYFWLSDLKVPLVGCIDDSSDGNYCLYDGCDGIYNVRNVFDSKIKVKWRPLGSNPWSKK